MCLCIVVGLYDFAEDMSHITKESFGSHHHILTCFTCRKRETDGVEKSLKGGGMDERIFLTSNVVVECHCHLKTV